MKEKEVMDLKKSMGVWERVWRETGRGYDVIITKHMILMTKASI